MQTNLNRILLIGVCGLFLLLYFILSCHNRFTPEDYLTATWVKTKGFTDTFKHVIHTWNVRFFSLSLAYLVTSFADNHISLFIYNIVSLVILTYGLSILLRSIFPKKHTSSEYFIRTILPITLLFFCTLSISETWFWCVSSVTYLWGLICLVYSLYFTIRHFNSKKGVDFILSLILWILLSGTYEVLAVIAILNLLFFSFYLKNKQLLWYAIACIIPLVFLFFTRGLDQRIELFQGSDVFTAMYRASRHVAMAFIEIIFYRLIFIIPLVITTCYVFPDITERIVVKYKISSSLLFLLINGFVATFILTIIMGGVALNRTALITSLVIFGILIIVCSHWLHTYKLYKYSFIATLSGIVLLLGMFYYTCDQYIITRIYAQNIDLRNQIITISKTAESTILLEPLPPAGLLYSAEIGTSVETDKNIFIKEYFGLTSGIKVSEK